MVWITEVLPRGCWVVRKPDTIRAEVPPVVPADADTEAVSAGCPSRVDDNVWSMTTCGRRGKAPSRRTTKCWCQQRQAEADREESIAAIDLECSRDLDHEEEIRAALEMDSSRAGPVET